MPVFEFNAMLVEVTFLYPTAGEPVTLECFDLRSEMLFSIFRNPSGDLVLKAYSENIPLDLVPVVAEMVQEGL